MLLTGQWDKSLTDPVCITCSVIYFVISVYLIVDLGATAVWSSYIWKGNHPPILFHANCLSTTFWRIIIIEIFWVCFPISKNCWLDHLLHPGTKLKIYKRFLMIESFLEGYGCVFSRSCNVWLFQGNPKKNRINRNDPPIPL